MKRLLTFVFALLPLAALANVEITSLRVNGLSEATGVDPTAPVSFSWSATSTDKGASQLAYEVSVYRGVIRIWSTGYIKSDNTISIPYTGRLLPDCNYSVDVRIWDNKNRVSKTASVNWTTGLRAEDWKAEMVGTKEGTQPGFLNLKA